MSDPESNSNPIPPKNILKPSQPSLDDQETVSAIKEASTTINRVGRDEPEPNEGSDINDNESGDYDEGIDNGPVSLEEQ